MLQFIAALVMGINAIIIGCDFPMWMQYSCCAYMLSFLVLFSDFYIKVKKYEVCNHQAALNPVYLQAYLKSSGKTNSLQNGNHVPAENGHSHVNGLNKKQNGNISHNNPHH